MAIGEVSNCPSLPGSEVSQDTGVSVLKLGQSQPNSGQSLDVPQLLASGHY